MFSSIDVMSSKVFLGPDISSYSFQILWWVVSKAFSLRATCMDKQKCINSHRLDWTYVLSTKCIV